jgi:hypothetical protein
VKIDYLGHFPKHLAANRLLERASSSHEMQDDHHQGNHEQYVDGRGREVKGEEAE